MATCFSSWFALWRRVLLAVCAACLCWSCCAWPGRLCVLACVVLCVLVLGWPVGVAVRSQDGCVGGGRVWVVSWARCAGCVDLGAVGGSCRPVRPRSLGWEDRGGEERRPGLSWQVGSL